jgi:hypothetical protein
MQMQHLYSDSDYSAVSADISINFQILAGLKKNHFPDFYYENNGHIANMVIIAKIIENCSVSNFA